MNQAEKNLEAAKTGLLASVQAHSPQKAFVEGKERRASRNPDGRPAADFKVTYVSVNGAKKVQRIASSYDAAVEQALFLLTLGETGEVCIEDRKNEVTWRME